MESWAYSPARWLPRSSKPVAGCPAQAAVGSTPIHSRCLPILARLRALYQKRARPPVHEIRTSPPPLHCQPADQGCTPYLQSLPAYVEPSTAPLGTQRQAGRKPDSIGHPLSRCTSSQQPAKRLCSRCRHTRHTRASEHLEGPNLDLTHGPSDSKRTLGGPPRRTSAPRCTGELSVLSRWGAYGRLSPCSTEERGHSHARGRLRLG